MKRDTYVTIIGQYDAACKEVLSQKVILAWILKDCLEDFHELSVESIMDQCIEYEPEVSSSSVDGERSEWFSQIRGGGREETSISEGRITYDIRFDVTIPETGRRLWIDVEPQNDFRPGYPLLKRGTYYLGRMISAQRNREFVGSDYDGLKKAYTVWICTNPPKKWMHRIKHYEVWDRDAALGNGESPMFDVLDYDLMTQVVICLGDPRDVRAMGVLRLLSVLLTNVYGLDEQSEILEREFGITLTDRLRKGMRSMCNLGEGLYNRAFSCGIETGIEQGVKQGIEQGVKQGIEQGMDCLGNLFGILLAENRFSEMKRVTEDESYRDQLILEYGLV